MMLESISVNSLWATQKLFWFNGSLHLYLYMNKKHKYSSDTYVLNYVNFAKTTLLSGLCKVAGFNTVHRSPRPCMIKVCWFQLHAWWPTIFTHAVSREKKVSLTLVDAHNSAQDIV